MFTLTSTEAGRCLQFTPPECESQSPAPLDLDSQVILLSGMFWTLALEDDRSSIFSRVRVVRPSSRLSVEEWNKERRELFAGSQPIITRCHHQQQQGLSDGGSSKT